MRALALLPILSCLFVGTAHSQTRQPSDLLSEDTRLLGKRTLRAMGITMRDLMADLTTKTGVKFAASAKVAEDKVVLVANDRPLADTLRSLARFFRFTWLRDGKPGEYSYTLTQTIAQQQAEDRERNDEVVHAADQIMKELAFVRSLADVPQADLKAKVDELEALQQVEKDPAKQVELFDSLGVYRDLSRSDGARIVARFLTGATREDILRLLTGEMTVFESPPQPNKLPLAERARDDILRAVREQNARNNRPTDELTFATLRFDGRTGAKPMLRGVAMAGNSMGSSGIGFSLPINFLYDRSFLDAPVEPADWKSLPDLTQPVTAHVTRPSVPSRERRPLPPPFLARALHEIGKERPFDVISDAFYATTGQGFDVNQKPLGEALAVLCQATRHRWARQDGFITLRSSRYAADRAGEPPFSRLSRWAKMPPAELYTLDRLAEIASQTFVQFETTVRVLQEIGALDRGASLGMARGHLTFWNALSSAQRAAARSEQGLAYRALNPNLRRMFELASTDRLASEGVHSSSQERSWLPEDLASAALRVISEERIMWGYLTSTGHSLTGGSPEQALEKLRKDLPELTLEQLERARSETVRFNYMAGGRNRFNGFLSLPIVWQSEPDK
jgi:hypothetical protein